MAIRRFVLRLLSFFRTGSAEAELSREIHSHLQLLEDEFVSQGMPRDEARLAARRAFGGVEQAKERQRDARGFRWLDNSRMDVKLGARMLAKYPALSLIGGAGLAVGVAIGAGFFAFLYSFLYATLPVEDGERIVALENWDIDANTEMRRSMHDLFVSNADVTNYNLEAITVPTLIIHTKDDQLASHEASQRAAERIPGVRFVSLESRGHLMLGQTKIIRDELADFFAERKDRRAEPVAS
jgi:pimeloyl-ACP methyl ester carboxylesterase